MSPISKNVRLPAKDEVHMRTAAMDAKTVREILDYDPATGIFRWKVDISCHQKGSVAGTPAKRYLSIRYQGRFYAVHRLAFLWMTGEWPKEIVDHADRDKLNNRWSNLREATISQNAQNRKASRVNKLGMKGVNYKIRFGVGKYEAHIRETGGKRHYLGRFDSAQEAYQAYLEAAKQLHGDFAHS